MHCLSLKMPRNPVMKRPNFHGLLGQTNLNVVQRCASNLDSGSENGPCVMRAMRMYPMEAWMGCMCTREPKDMEESDPKHNWKTQRRNEKTTSGAHWICVDGLRNARNATSSEVTGEPSGSDNFSGRILPGRRNHGGFFRIVGWSSVGRIVRRSVADYSFEWGPTSSGHRWQQRTNPPREQIKYVAGAQKSRRC